jgi:LemA protein
MKGCLVVLVVVAAVLLGVGGCGVSQYNGIVSSQENVDAQWVEIRNQYKRRADLIPNLVNTVEGARDFERETLEAVIEKRRQVTNLQVPESVIEDPAVSESYPDLKATAAFRDLTVALEGTENRIAVARRDYVEAVKAYNVRIRKFPGNLVAGVFGFDEAPQLEIQGEALEEPPVVDFGEK